MNDENKHSTDTPALRHSAPAELPSSEQPLIDFPENKKANPDAGASSKGQENSDNNQKYPSLFANISSSIRNFFSPTTSEPNGENSSVNTSLDTLEAKGDNSSKNDQSTPRESLSNLSEKSNISQVSSSSSESESKISDGSAPAVSELSTSSLTNEENEAKQPQQFNATIGSPLEPQNENNPKNSDPNNKPDSVSSTFNMWKPQHQTFSSAISQDNKDSNIQQAALWYHTSAASCYAQDPNNSLYLEEVEQFNEYADKVFKDDFKLNNDQIDEIKKLQQPPLDTVGNDGLSLRQIVSDQLEEFSRSKKSDNGSWPFFINTSSTSGLSSGTVSPEGNQFTVNKNASTLSLTGSSAESIGSNLVEASIDMGMYSNPNEKVRYTLYGDVGKKLDSILDRLDENETNIDQACFTLNGYKCNDLEALQNALNNPEHPLYQSLRGDWTWHSASYKRQKLRTKIQHLIEKRDNQKVQQKSSTPQPVDARHFTRSAIVKRAAMHEHPTRACHDSMVNNIKGMKDHEKTKLLEDADGPSKNRIFTAVCESCGLTKEEAETVSSANKLTGCSSIAKNLEKKLEKVKALLPKQSQNPSPYQTVLNNFDNRTKLDKLVNSA
ncbi:MAG: hypothetical protein VX112_05885 [Pseudomonadota bacterium]|nr:hypothetical protein [Pseudomonadota bacterium]